jgi:geranylgeranyl reductase family protein
VRDVIVIGGGPAGLVAASTLSSHGRDVLVLEEHADIGYPVHCTGVLGVEAFDELDLPRQTIRGVTSGASFRAASGTSVLVEAEHIRAAIIDRGAFDHALADAAGRAGASVLTQARAVRVSTGPRGVEIQLRDGRQFKARACVLACGANYRFNRALGLGVPRLFLQSAQIETPFPATDHVEVRFGRAIAPGGFAWVVPFRRHGTPYARVGLMSESRAASRFREFTEALARDHDVATGRWPAPRLKILPLAPVTKTYAPRVLAVGDAAGLVKPTTGGGIYYGVLSGRLAAEVLQQALVRDRLDQRGLRAYEHEWRRRFGAEIRAGLAFRAVAARLDDGAIDALVHLARVDGLVPMLKRTANFNWHRDAALALLRNASFRRIVAASLWG